MDNNFSDTTEIYNPNHAAGEAPKQQPLLFHGTGGEYFGIWIVNLLLSIVTLGIYSAWATVRTRQYFYRNTEMAGSRFEFHGKALNILIGRIIAVGIFLLLLYGELISPTLVIIVFVVMVLLFPWFIRGFWRFNLNNSSWRGIFFALNTSTSAMYQVILKPVLMAIGLGVVSSGLMAGFPDSPMVLMGMVILFLTVMIATYVISFSLHNHVFTRVALGNLHFSFPQALGPWFRIILAMIWYSISFGFVVGVAVLILFFIVNAIGGVNTDDPATLAMLIFVAYVVILIPYALIGAAVWQAKSFRYVFTNLRSNSLSFSTDINGLTVFRILIVNSLAVLFTLGLAYPWAAIRLAKYKVQSVTCIGELDNIEGDKQQHADALGDEVSSVMGWDLGA